MSQRKSTKRALIASMISLLLCFAMLIGTTFAWFTDAVTTGKNKIVAGNLDVELYVKEADSDSYVAVDETTSLFDESALWEPGYTQAVYLKVANVGALALKYQLAVNVISEQKGTNVAGEEFSLSDYLVFGQAVNAAEATYATREEAWAAAGNTQGLNDYSGEGRLKAGEEGFVALIVYMPVTVGNEANYRGDDIPSIDLGVTLVATQDAVERDSFNNEYDENAIYPVADSASLAAALKAGGSVILGANVVYNQNTNPDIDTTAARTTIIKSTTLDLSGNEITFDSVAGNSNWAVFYLQSAKANMTVNGEGTIDAAATTGAYCFHLTGNQLSKPVLTINGGTYIGTPTAVNVEYGTAYINGGFFHCRPAGTVTEDAYRYTLNCIDANYTKGYAKIIVTGGTFVNFNPADNQAEGPGTNFVADGYTVVSEPQDNGDIWYTVIPE